MFCLFVTTGVNEGRALIGIILVGIVVSVLCLFYRLTRYDVVIVWN